MAVVPTGFIQQIAELIEILDAAASDPNPIKMKAAREAYARGKKLSLGAHARGPAQANLEPDLDVLSATRRTFEAAADRVRKSLHDQGLLDESPEDRYLLALKTRGGRGVSLLEMCTDGDVFFVHPLRDGAILLGHLANQGLVKSEPSYGNGNGSPPTDYKVTLTPAGNEHVFG
jgi:hypothetical protein